MVSSLHRASRGALNNVIERTIFSNQTEIYASVPGIERDSREQVSFVVDKIEEPY